MCSTPDGRTAALLVVTIACHDSSSRLALHPVRRVQIGKLFRARSLIEDFDRAFDCPIDQADAACCGQCHAQDRLQLVVIEAAGGDGSFLYIAY